MKTADELRAISAAAAAASTKEAVLARMEAAAAAGETTITVDVTTWSTMQLARAFFALRDASYLVDVVDEPVRLIISWQ